SFSSHLDPPSGPPQEQTVELIGADGTSVLTMSWAYGADFSAAAGVPVTLTIGGRTRSALVKDHQLVGDTSLNAPAGPVTGEQDHAALAASRALARRVFAGKNPFQPATSDDEPVTLSGALGTISSTAQIGAVVYGAAGLVIAGPAGAGIGATVGGLWG